DVHHRGSIRRCGRGLLQHVPESERRPEERRRRTKGKTVKATRAIAFFAGVSATLIIVATIVLRNYFRSVDQHNAMLISAGLAFAVQLGSYALLRPARRGHGAPG